VRRYDLISSLGFMLLAAYVVWSGFRLGFGEWREPGPGFIAVLVGVLLGGLSGICLAVSRRGAAAADAARRFFPETGSGRRVGLIVAALAAFALLLDRLGFLISTVLFLLFLLRTIQPQRWRTTLVMSVATAIVCVVVFQLWLQVQLPEGPINIYALMKRIR
jgi:hypothetical protein